MTAQDNFSNEQLTGKGDLVLTEGEIILQPEVKAAFVAMAAAAAEEGISIEVVSGYRSFEHQKTIWNRKYKSYTDEGMTGGEAVSKIIEYSTLPGTSRHHWGTEIDIIDSSVELPENLLSEEHFKEGGSFARLTSWMDRHAEKFGFYLVYPDDAGRKGFHFEPWHFSYQSISTVMLQQFLNIDIPTMIAAMELEGKEYLTPDFLKAYKKNHILDINPDLK